MPVIHPAVNLFPSIFNSDRNIIMLSSSNHTWDKDTGIWTWDNIIYIDLMANREAGLAEYNQIASGSVTINASEVAYVTLDQDTNGAVLTIQTAPQANLPNDKDTYVIAMRCSNIPTEPLLLNNGIMVRDDSGYNQTTGKRNAFKNFYSGVTWTVVHNLKDADVVIVCKDTTVTPNRQVTPEIIEFQDSNTVVVTFNESVTGKAIVMKGII